MKIRKVILPDTLKEIGNPDASIEQKCGFPQKQLTAYIEHPVPGCSDCSYERENPCQAKTCLPQDVKITLPQDVKTA